MTILVRPSLATDIPAITAIYAHAVTHGTASFELTPPDAAEMARRRVALVEAGFPYLVAERGGEILGYAYAGPYRPRPAYRSTVEDSIYVAPAAQATGIGRRLLTELIREAEARDFRLMVAVIGDSANSASITLHHRAGFTLCGTIHSVGYKFGRWLDSVIMQLPLGEGDASAPAERSTTSG